MSIELPDGSTHRNIQEQVAQNMSDIAELQELIEESQLEDKVINLTASSGTLSSDELTIAESDPAFITYNDTIYVKGTDDGTYITFAAADLQSSTSANITTISQSIFTITKSNGAYVYSSNTLLTYPEVQDAVDLTFTLSGTYSSLASITNVYNRLQVIGGRLSLVANFYITNESGSSITISAGTLIARCLNPALSDDVVENIYDFNNTPVSDVATSANVLITETDISVVNSITDVYPSRYNGFKLDLFNRASAGRLDIMIPFSSTATSFALADGKSLYFTGRILLDLV